MFNSPSYEWNFKSKTFGIQVRAFKKGADKYEEFGWCMYVLVYDNHTLFEKAELFADSLDFHGGCTFEEKHTISPARGIKYEWQKDSSYLKIGCDYQHDGDNFEHENPCNGIPHQIQKDAEYLFAQMSEYSKFQA